MDHNLEDSLTMESIENMDFDHSGVVVNQEDITLEEGVQAGDMPMDLDTIEEQPALLNAGSEEVIVSDFIGEQFGFQEYSMQGENSSGANITIEANQLSEMTGQNEQIVNLQYNDCVNKASTSQSNVITIKATPQHRGGKKVQPTAALPRQVAIAPKPTKGASNVQYAIAPKPVALVMNKNANLSKTVHMKNVVQGLKGNTVLAQIGKQLVMVPAGSAGQKIKLSNISSTDGNIQFLRCSSDSAQLIANKGGAKQMRTKFIVHGQSHSDPSNQPAVITKLVPVSTASQARYVMQQKTVPISIGGNKVVLTTPPKQAVKVAPKKPMIAIKTQSPKVVTSQPNIQTQKVVITANPTPTLKSAATKTQVQIVKDNTTGQRTQLHPINVPGKGIQYIKLVTNQPPTPKPAPKPTLAMSGKNFLLTDSKGNILQMTAEKVMSSQPPPLLVTTATTSGSSKVPPKLTKKLVRIAPVSHKADMPSAKVREASKIAHCLQSTAVPTSRAPQSLLAPRAAAPAGSSLLEFSDLAERSERSAPATSAGDTGTDTGGARDVKPTLASLISDAVGEDESVPEINSMEEVEIEYENTSRKQEHFTEDENTNSMEHESSNERLEESVIVVPSNVPDFNTSQDEEDMYHDDTDMSMEDHSRNVQLNIDADVMAHLSPQRDQSFSDSVLMYDGKPESAAGPGLRPRKACNCTKSQCLKLYCDCFANGEFCNKCNCNNCHNNLENEELRQKAIRACLERNPNAFRPKIGKSKAGGPEIIRRHNKGCNCKRSGCLKNYCECYEAKIACTLMCKCVGCRNIEETLERRRDALRLRDKLTGPTYRPPLPLGQMKQPCSFMTPEVIEAVAQCMLATVGDAAAGARAEPGALAEPGARGPRPEGAPPDPVEDILLEFSRCMADIISASHQAL